MATAQVQEAARKVLLENKQLRALLAEKGVSTAEIEAFLHGYNSITSFTVALPSREPADMVNTQRQVAPLVDIQQPVEIHASDAMNQLVSLASPPAMQMDIGLESASQSGKNGNFIGSSSDTELLRPGEQAEKDLERGSPLPNLLEHISDCYCPEIEPVPGQLQSSETECSVAANILAGFWELNKHGLSLAVPILPSVVSRT